MSKMGETIVAQDLEMLKAMYNFDATQPKTLSFLEGEHFLLHHTNTKQRNWWQVINDQGKLGFVPSNYVTAVVVDPHFMKDFLNKTLKNINEDPTPEKQELIDKLLSKQKVIENLPKTHNKKQAPQPPVRDDSELNDGRSSCDFKRPNNEHRVNNFNPTPDILPEKQHSTSQNHQNGHTNERLHNSKSVVDCLDKKTDPETKVTYRSQSSPNMQAPIIQQSDEQLQSTLYTMVDLVRRDTRLSHELSRVAVSTVLDCLMEVLPRESSEDIWGLATMASSNGPLPATCSALRNSPDYRHLRAALSALTACANDAQQRAWALHDDDHFITQHLEEVNSILSNADIRVSRDVLSMDHYDHVNTLVLFYQMETRWHIRELLIKTFHTMCTLEYDVVKALCSSVLPQELARDMLANQSDSCRLISSAKMLSILLSMGYALPLSHFEQLDMEFVSFLLELIEKPPDSDLEEQISEQFLRLVLALNLQFTDVDNNLVLEALQCRSDAKVFTEKLLLLLNREGKGVENDPVKVLDHQPAAPHSVLKLSLDVFSLRTTAALFYTNDTKVLLDITVRQLADLSPGDLRRGLYLQLCLGILRHTDYNHCHRQADLLRCFTRIFCEEGELSIADQALVRTISNEFPQYFKA